MNWPVSDHGTASEKQAVCRCSRVPNGPGDRLLLPAMAVAVDAERAGQLSDAGRRRTDAYCSTHITSSSLASMPLNALSLGVNMKRLR